MLSKLFCFVLLISNISSSPSTKQKRQIFRENLLSQFGGKVPDSAFNKNRLALNRFNQNGFYTSDGEYVEQRPHLHNNKHLFYDTIKINVPPNHLTTQTKSRKVDTSYLMREPVYYNIVPMLMFHTLPALPVLSLSLLRRGFKNKSVKPIDDDILNEITADEILRQMPPHVHSFLHHDD